MTWPYVGYLWCWWEITKPWLEGEMSISWTWLALLVSYREVKISYQGRTRRKWKCCVFFSPPRVTQHDQSSSTTDVYSETFLCLLSRLSFSRSNAVHNVLPKSSYPAVACQLSIFDCEISRHVSVLYSHIIFIFEEGRTPVFLSCIISNTVISFKSDQSVLVVTTLAGLINISSKFTVLFQSYHEFANYLCREVFTDMSVLPLVFPSNISCFSSGSYKVRKKQNT